MGLLGFSVLDAIKAKYERSGYHAYSVEAIKPKRVVNVDLGQLWESVEPPATEEPGQEVSDQA